MEQREIQQNNDILLQDQPPATPEILKNIKGLFEVVSAVPTEAPKDLYGSVKIYGTTVYFYNYITNAWLPLGNFEIPSGTALPTASANTNKLFRLTTTDTLYFSNGSSWIALN